MYLLLGGFRVEREALRITRFSFDILKCTVTFRRAHASFRTSRAARLIIIIIVVVVVTIVIVNATPMVEPILVKVAERAVLDDVMKERIELILQRPMARKRFRRGQLGGMGDECHTKSYPRRNFFVIHGRRVLSKLKSGLPPRRQVL